MASAGGSATAWRTAPAAPSSAAPSARPAAAQHRAGVGGVGQDREAVELGVGAGHVAAEEVAQPHPHHHPGAGDDQREGRVVERQRPVAVAERLERADLEPLGLHQPGERHRDQEGGHPEEDGRQDGGHGVELADLVGDEAVRDQPVAGLRPQRPVAPQHAVEAVDDVARPRRPGASRTETELKAPSRSRAAASSVARHPEDAVGAVVGEEAPGRHGVDELRREGHAGDGHRLAAAVHGER